MKTPAKFSAALIAGGKSSRFGDVDKAFLDWDGRPLFAHQLGKLARLGAANIFLSANADQPFPDFIDGVEIVIDEAEDIGPMGGLAACLEKCETEFLLVLAVDLPDMPVEFLEMLAARGEAVIPKIGDRFEPLAAVFPKSLLPAIRAKIEEGDFSLQHLIRESQLKTLAVESEAETAFFANVNRPDDLNDALDQPIFLNRFHVAAENFQPKGDFVATESPLEIRIGDRSVAVMMRTPGHDDELAAGFLVTESVIQSASDLAAIENETGNALRVELAEKNEVDLDSLTRHVFTSSSCGVCGKATIDSVFQQFPPIPVGDEKVVTAEVLLSLPDKLRTAQATFDRTGGLHASAIFDFDGNLQWLREDVGRHNALDKVIGRAALDDRLPLAGSILLVSGRISFELMQKSLAAGIPIVAGISAPSSLAVEVAAASGQTLVGFLRERNFNVYAHKNRIQPKNAQ